MILAQIRNDKEAGRRYYRIKFDCDNTNNFEVIIDGREAVFCMTCTKLEHDTIPNFDL